MPASFFKGKGTKSGPNKRKGRKQDGAEEPGDAKKLLKAYERNCVLARSRMCLGIISELKLAAEEGNTVTTFIFESDPPKNEGDLPVLLEPFISSLRQERYKHIRDLYIWDYPMLIEDAATLALFLEKSCYPIRMIELLDCLLDPPGISRLVKPFNSCDLLTTLILDYNEFGDEGCKNLCDGLEGNKNLLSLSLCYCNLNIRSGSYLGHIVSTTAVRELYLDGNELQCEGSMELIKLCVTQAELEAYLRADEVRKRAEEATEKAEQESALKLTGTVPQESDPKKNKRIGVKGIKSGKKTGKGKRKKKKKPKGPPPKGPWIHKLHLADNGIDGYGDSESLAPIICMRLFKKLIMNSKCLEELDLEDNSIGELGAREITEGLKLRKEAKLGTCQIRITHKVTTNTFTSIIKLGSRLKRKGKKRTKKGKNKR